MGFPTYLKQFKNFADFLARGKGALSEADLALGKQYFDQMEKYNARKAAWEKVYGDKLRNLPESNAGLTQVTNTVPTYSKAGEELRRLGAEGPAIDFGAGKGLGTKHLGPQVESYEPFPEAGFSPTFTNAADIPSDKYGALANLNVLTCCPERYGTRLF